MCNLLVYVDKLSYGDKFIVTQSDLQDVSIILGRNWQKKYNCLFNWKNNLVHCQSEDHQLWVPLQCQDKGSTKQVKQNKEQSQQVGSSSIMPTPQTQSSNNMVKTTILPTLKRKPKIGVIMSTIHLMVWVPKPKQREQMWSNSQIAKLHRQQQVKSAQMSTTRSQHNF